MAQTSAPSELDLELAAQLGAAVSRLLRVARRTKMAVGSGSDRIEVTSVPLLVALAEGGPMRSAALAAAVLSDPSTVSRQIAALVEADLVERRPDPADRRANLLDLTTAGRDALAAHRRARDVHIALVTAAWPVHDRRRIADLIDRLAADLTSDLQPTTDPAADYSVPASQEHA